MIESLASRYPELAREWHPTKNGDLLPTDVTPGSARVVWWCCSANPPHQWQAMIKRRVKSGRTCPSCDLKARSLAAVFPALAEQWHPTRNKPLTWRRRSKRDPSGALKGIHP